MSTSFLKKQLDMVPLLPQTWRPADILTLIPKLPTRPHTLSRRQSHTLVLEILDKFSVQGIPSQLGLTVQEWRESTWVTDRDSGESGIFAEYAPLTTVLRNGLKGLAASMAIVVGAPYFAIAIRWRWHINPPIPTDTIGTLPQAISIIIWILVAMLFVLAAQLIVERIEI